MKPDRIVVDGYGVQLVDVNGEPFLAFGDNKLASRFTTQRYRSACAYKRDLASKGLKGRTVKVRVTIEVIS